MTQYLCFRCNADITNDDTAVGCSAEGCLDSWACARHFGVDLASVSQDALDELEVFCPRHEEIGGAIDDDGCLQQQMEAAGQPLTQPPPQVSAPSSGSSHVVKRNHHDSSSNYMILAVIPFIESRQQQHPACWLQPVPWPFSWCTAPYMIVFLSRCRVTAGATVGGPARHRHRRA